MAKKKELTETERGNLEAELRVFADAALPPGYIDQKDSGSPTVVVLIAAVVVIAAVIIIRALTKRNKK